MLTTRDFFRDLDWIFDVPAGKEPKRYPLTDISYNDDSVFIDIAVAGFGPDDIDVELQGDTLVITGTRNKDEKRESEKDGLEYIQRHISTSSFTRKIKLHPDFVGGDIEASYKNGILSIKVSKKEKPKKLIEIKTS